MLGILPRGCTYYYYTTAIACWTLTVAVIVMSILTVYLGFYTNHMYFYNFTYSLY